MTAKEAKLKLEEGNRKYLEAKTASIDVSQSIREKTATEGQHPYAVIVACSDSRVIPENIFSAGIGELFVIRIAGNVMGKHQLGSIEYAAEHLGTNLIVVLGHTKCGAINAAIGRKTENYIRYITDKILNAIGDETDDFRACCLNVKQGCKRIEDSFQIQKQENERGLMVVGAVYHIESGKVEFL